MIKYIKLLFLMLFLTVMLTKAQTSDFLSENFKNPPAATKPWVYWYWISDHISKEGITKDLEAMAKVGIGEALIGNIDEIKQKGNVKALTEEWFQMIDHAIREGKRTGVNVGLFNSPGWSQSGGPWNKPENSMRYLIQSELKVKGPQKFSAKLTKPAEQFQDVAVLAFASPLNDDNFLSNANSTITSTPETENSSMWFDGNKSAELSIPTAASTKFVLNFNLLQPFTVRSLTLYPSHTSFRAQCELQYLQSDGTFKSFKAFSIERTNNSTSVGFIPYAPICESFAATSSTKFRLIFSNINGIAGFSEIALSGAARTERFAEKQLAKLWPTPAPLWDAYLWKPQAEMDDLSTTIQPQKVLNISSKMKSDGTLEWDVPAGYWIIQRFGMTSTGQKNAPASVEATGLEIDKMNSQWVAGHFDAYIGRIVKRLPASERTALKHIVADSYETGAQNWTDGLAADFEKQFGYDPTPFLPVISGRVVGNADQSDRFLWDLRRLIADRISYQYVGGLRQKANEYGLKLWLENYGHWGYPGEFLQYGGQSDEIGGEFWTGDDSEGLELRAASSAAHGYGKNVIHAEAFTSGGPMWNWDPWSLKKRGDWAATKGINHFVMHVYIHQPYEDKIPGINAWFGVEFNRHNTWFYQSKEWIEYMRRTHYLLQQGKYVADVAYFIGEDAPKMTGVRNPSLPDGYNFDYVNAEVIEKMTIQKNCFVLPDGMSYRVLVLPPQNSMRPKLLGKLKQLIADGGIVVGPAPNCSPSLQNYPESDLQVKQLAQEIWQGCDGVHLKKCNFGKGMIYQGVTLSELFADLNLVPDVGGMDAKLFPWIHRSSPEAEIYYISNQKDVSAEFAPSFRVAGLQPELWNPVTKEQRDLPAFTIENGKTTVPLVFAPRESYFIVFRKKVTTRCENPINFVRMKTMGILEGPWTVTFDKKWGTTASVVFENLDDWTKRSEPEIKFFSGTACYRKLFDAPSIKKGQRIYLNLGVFNVLAMVRLNGQSLGLVWAEPHLIVLPETLKSKNNVLEIEVTNTWNNRLVGDAALPAEKRMTRATTSPDANATLLPSGLIGPVTLQVFDGAPYVQKITIVVDKPLIAKPEKALVTMNTLTSDAKIHYTTDGSQPTESSPLYSCPIELDTYSLIAAKAFKKGYQASEVSKLEVESFDPKVNGLNYEYFEGEWTKIADFEKLTPLRTGRSMGIDIASIKARDDHFGIVFTGKVSVPFTGVYTFHLLSDDGSQLYIDGKLIVDNDGFHGEVEKSGKLELKEGKHFIRVTYFDNVNGEALKLFYSLKGSKIEVPLRLFTYE